MKLRFWDYNPGHRRRPPTFWSHQCQVVGLVPDEKLDFDSLKISEGQSNRAFHTGQAVPLTVDGSPFNNGLMVTGAILDEFKI